MRAVLTCNNRDRFGRGHFDWTFLHLDQYLLVFACLYVYLWQSANASGQLERASPKHYELCFSKPSHLAVWTVSSLVKISCHSFISTRLQVLFLSSLPSFCQQLWCCECWLSPSPRRIYVSILPLCTRKTVCCRLSLVYWYMLYIFVLLAHTQWQSIFSYFTTFQNVSTVYCFCVTAVC